MKRLMILYSTYMLYLVVLIRFDAYYRFLGVVEEYEPT